MIFIFTMVLLLTIGSLEPRNTVRRDMLLVPSEASVVAVSIMENGFNLILDENLENEDSSKLISDMNHKRVPRGAKNSSTKRRDQQASFSVKDPRPFDPNDYFTTPKIQLSNETWTLDSDRGQGNGSTVERGITRIHNPLYPLTDSSYSAYAVLFLSLIVFAVGIVGNLAVMCIVWHNYYMKSAWNCILASLAFWDFLVLFFCLPMVIFHELTKKRLLGDFSCRIVPYIEVTSLGVTTFSLCALGIDRFQAATSAQPKPRQVEPCQSILSKLAVVWVGSMVLAVPELLLWQLNQDVLSGTGDLLDSCSMKPSSSLPESIYSLVLTYHDARMWWYFGCYFCLPMLFTVACQLVTQHVAGEALRKQGERPAPSPKKQPWSQHHQGPRERQFNCTVVALAVVYGVCALPENVCNIALAYTSVQVSGSTSTLLALINHFFLFFKSSVTPVLLLCLCKSLGQSFMDCCCCCCEECLPEGGSSPSQTTTSSDGPAGEIKLKKTAEVSSSIFFDKAKDSSSILAVGSSC